MGGDFNIITTASETNSIFEPKSYMKQMDRLIKEENLIDIHKIINQDIRYTFTTNQNKRIRLDKFLTSQPIQKRIHNYYITPNTYSDHDQITIQIDLGIRKKWGKTKSRTKKY